MFSYVKRDALSDFGKEISKFSLENSIWWLKVDITYFSAWMISYYG